MSSAATPLPRPSGLQDVPALTPASAEAGVLATIVMRSEVKVSDAIRQVAEHFSRDPRVDGVVAALTTFAPDDDEGWVHLGQRAWLREWVREGSPCRSVPVEGSGPEATLTMPWMSQLIRRGVAVIPDAHLLPAEAAQDQRELASCGIRAQLGSAQHADGIMYGSMSVVSSQAGPWSDTLVADLRLLSAALTSRMSAEQAKRSLADAIALAEQAHASQQQFFATIGHELRTPISAILGFAEVLSDEAEELETEGLSESGSPARLEKFPSTVLQDAGIILRAGEQLLAIVEDLLRTGRVLGDEEDRGAVSVGDAVQDVVHWLRTPARATQVNVSTDVPADLTAWATASGLRQVITNLVSNAILHNNVGGTVVVSAIPARGESGEPRVRIIVKDSGPGLTPDQQQRAFQPFVRFAGPEVRGTGLGLSLSRAITERHGGALGVESTPGQGSTFWVDLPATG